MFAWCCLSVGLLLTNSQIPAEFRYLLEWTVQDPYPVDIERMEADCTRLLDVADELPPEVQASVLLRRGVLRSRLSRFDEALPDLERALEISPESIEASYELVRTLVRQGKIDEAANRAQEMIKSYPKRFQGHSTLAYCRYKQKRYRSAIISLNDAIALSPEHSGLYAVRAGCYYEIGEFEKCLWDNERSYILSPWNASDPGDKESFLCHIQSLIGLKRSKDAIRWATALAEEDRDDPRVWASLWLCYNEAQLPASALAVAMGFTEKFPDHSDAHRVLAVSQAENAEFDSAEKSVLRAIELDDESSANWKIKGIVAWSKGEWDVAVEAFKHANKINEGDMDLAIRMMFFDATCPDAPNCPSK